MASSRSDQERLFNAAAELSDLAQRAAFLDAACGGDETLRAGIEGLLRHDLAAGSFLESPAVDPKTTANVPSAAASESPGTVIGPYKLLQQIGEGGMGVVYMAEQQEPVRRKVALKIIKPGMDSHQVIARFESERQALAMMEHQNIARVLDAGTTESGRPYFVMELVHGVPITRYCDDNKLTPRERLALFVPVCQAIQHAHQKGIIHRHVKPSNVLVTMYDDKPVPKVIDFGVAKAIEQRLTEKTMFTQFGALVGTFEYMSPEQAEMNAFGVDTRSDIYSLGVLLYELLTGTTPLERTRLREAALDEMVRLIREEEAQRPSLRLSSSNDLPKIAAARKTEPARLSKLVRGEIDWIVMKCLEKDRSRRYDTANGMARDLERYLADEPVEACPPSSTYRLRKFARRYKKALVTAAAFAILLVASTVLSTLLAFRATSAEGEANRQRIASDKAKQGALDAKAEADKQRDEARLTAYAYGIGLAQRAWEEKNVVRARELLEEVPKEAAGRDLRGFEWYYLSRMYHSEVLTFKGHAGYVSSVAFSPDGQCLLASPSADETVKIWDCATGKELFALKGHHGVTSVAFSPDGQRLASGSSDGTVKIWDRATSKELFALGHAGEVWCVEFSPDGQRLASGSMNKLTADATVKIWDSATGKELFTVMGLSGPPGVAFSPDGQRLASGSGDGSVKIWDSATGKQLFSLNGHTDRVTSVAFSPDGQQLASGGFDTTVKIWDSATGKRLFSLNGHAGCVWSMAYSPDGQRLASAGADKTVKIWDSATGTELFVFEGHTDTVWKVAFSPDGQRLASASWDLTVKIWNSAPELFSLNGHAGQITSVAFSPDSQRLASAGANTVNIWDSATGTELFVLEGHTDTVEKVAFSPDGQRLASASTDKTVRIWDSATGKQLFSLKGHAGRVTSVAFSPEGQRLASGSMNDVDGDGTVKIWNSATGKELITLNGISKVSSVAFSPDGQRLASVGDDETVKIWDSASGKELFSFKGHAGPVRSAAFSPDGQRLALARADQTVSMWDSATGKELFSLKGHAGSVESVAFSPDGQRLATASEDQTVKIWDSATGKELFSLKGLSFGPRVAFSPDGQRLATATGDGFIRLWETINLSPDIRQARVTNWLVANLFGKTPLRADVLERLRTLPGLSRTQRQAAFAVARTYHESAGALNGSAWELVKLPGREMSGYRKGLRHSEEACQLEPKNGLYLNTLGVAYYRVGNYEKALATLQRSDEINKTQFKFGGIQRSDEINKTQFKGSIPDDLAFLAMTQQQLGHAKEAQAELQRLRGRMKDPRWAQDAEAQGFLHEAEALLAKPKTPSSK